MLTKKMILLMLLLHMPFLLKASLSPSCPNSLDHELSAFDDQSCINACDNSGEVFGPLDNHDVMAIYFGVQS